MVAIAQIEEKIADFVCKNAHVRTITKDERFFESGLVTSMFALQIVAFVEKELNMALDDDDLNIQNFASVEAIANFIAGKQEAAEVV